MHITTSQLGKTSTPRSQDIQEVAPCVPSWVSQLLGPCIHSADSNSTLQRGTHFSLLSIAHPYASELPALEFRAAAAALYQQAREILSANPAIPPHLVRIWNFIPAIHDCLGDGLDRYRVFNHGRFDACAEWFHPVTFRRFLPTATGIGHRGHDLVIHFLTSTQRGTPLENPRQCPAFEYSTKLGPRPPCFSRATILDQLLIIGGTASVRGEDSVHPGSLVRQIQETFVNLTSLLAAADSARVGSSGYSISHARVYAPILANNMIDAASHNLIKKYFGNDCDVEYFRADICRAELLVEIEAIAKPALSHTKTC